MLIAYRVTPTAGRLLFQRSHVPDFRTCAHCLYIFSPHRLSVYVSICQRTSVVIVTSLSRGWLCHPLLITLRRIVVSSFAWNKVGAIIPNHQIFFQ